MQTQVQTTAQRFNILPTERACFVGTTGCGKSTLAKSLLAARPNVVVYDVKREFDLPTRRIVENPYDLGKQRVDDPRPIIYRPHPDFWSMPYYEGFFRWAYERRRTLVYVDEQYALMDGVRYPHWQQACLTQGRSLEVACWMSTQRPKRVPVSLISESDHYFVFSTTMLDDRKHLAEQMGEEVLTKPKERHNFFYWYKHGGNPPVEIALTLPTKRRKV